MDELDDESINGEHVVQQGFRQARNRTNWLYRGTAMTTTDSMDIHELRLQAFDFETALGFITGAFATMTMTARARMQQHLPIESIRIALDYISVAISWIVCYLEMIYMDIEDRLYYVHTARPPTASKNRHINDLQDDNESEILFGFKIQELYLLLLHWRIPQHFRMNNRIFTGEEAMLIFLFYIRKAITYTEMSRTTFGGDPRMFTYFIRSMVNHLHDNFYHKISGDSMNLWVDNVDDFRRAIWEKMQAGVVHERDRHGREVDWEVWIPLENFRIFGWLDDTDLLTTRPRPGRRIENQTDIMELRDTQQAFYK